MNQCEKPKNNQSPPFSAPDSLIVKTDTFITPDSIIPTKDTLPQKDSLPPKPIIKKKKVSRDTSKDHGDYGLIIKDSAKNELPFIDSLYVYATPWGGRHFDSVTVSLHCREDCLIMYSLSDSLHLKTYNQPFTLTRNTNLWLSGINESGEKTRPIKIPYIIKKDPGKCTNNMLPIIYKDLSFCIDIYEWPNQEGSKPLVSINQKEASNKCESIGKRLCTTHEWETSCSGLKKNTYPYGKKYNENYCPAKEAFSSRSGRFPACRSYFGLYDLTGNVWEWTGTPSKKKEGFFMVAGGTWNSGNNATCQEKKYSFYPDNQYLFVGFRCCKTLE